jgi:hypothetical protein
VKWKCEVKVGSDLGSGWKSGSGEEVKEELRGLVEAGKK